MSALRNDILWSCARARAADALDAGDAQNDEDALDRDEDERGLARPSAQEREGASRELAIAPLSAIAPGALPRSYTGLGALDRVLGQGERGQGLVRGQALVLGGEPGAGKSTLLLQALAGLCASGARALYATGEESQEQVAGRARRLGLGALDRVHVLETRALEDVERAIATGRYLVAVADSLQVLRAADLSSEPGTVPQVKAAAERLTAIGKATGTIVWCVGQATKDGKLAGPLAAAHAVDTLLWLERDASGGYRIVRSLKNRFGPEGELALFEMRAAGLVEVTDPSALFVGARRDRARPAGSAWAAVAEASQPLVLEVQALVTEASLTAPRRLASGVEPGRLALLLAVLERRAGLAVAGDVYVDLDAGLRVTERALDLPLALALASAARGVPLPVGLVAFGEIALTGEVRAVPRASARLSEAARLGFTRALVPAEALSSIDHALDRAACEGLTLAPVATLAQALEAPP